MFLGFGDRMDIQTAVTTAGHILKRLIFRHIVIVFCRKGMIVKITVQVSACIIALVVDKLGVAEMRRTRYCVCVIVFHRNTGDTTLCRFCRQCRKLAHPADTKLLKLQPIGIVPVHRR